MPAATHVALIRGINVGGKNIVPMAALRVALTEAGLGDVRTYIQSGNVLFSTKKSTEAANNLVERVLADGFGVTTVVVTVPAAMFRDVVDQAPKGFGEGDHRRWDVIFLRPSLPVAKALEVVRTREGVDEVDHGKHAIYFSRLEAQASRTRLTAIVGTPAYKDMTIRNWRTTARLSEMIDHD